MVVKYFVHLIKLIPLAAALALISCGQKDTENDTSTNLKVISLNNPLNSPFLNTHKHA